MQICNNNTVKIRYFSTENLSQNPRQIINRLCELMILKTYDLYGPVPYVMLLMRANLLRETVGRGWALEIETFLGPVKWHRVVS
jgi:hypothetical protein